MIALYFVGMKCKKCKIAILICMIKLRMIQNINNVPVLIVSGLVVSETTCCGVDDIMFDYL